MIEMMHAAKVLFRLCNVSVLKEVQLGRLDCSNTSMMLEDADVKFGSDMNAVFPEVVTDPILSLFNTIVTNTIALESLQCCFSIYSYDTLSRFSHSLQQLNLKLSSNEDQQASDGRIVRQCAQHLQGAIQDMPNLKNLILNVQFPMELHITSNSVPHIDVYQSHQNMWVMECICPSLEKFTCRYDKNGVRSIHPLSQMEVQEYEGKKGIRVDDIPFRGMIQVPKECKVFLKLLWNDLVSSGGDDLM